MCCDPNTTLFTVMCACKIECNLYRKICQRPTMIRNQLFIRLSQISSVCMCVLFFFQLLLLPFIACQSFRSFNYYNQLELYPHLLFLHRGFLSLSMNSQNCYCRKQLFRMVLIFITLGEYQCIYNYIVPNIAIIDLQQCKESHIYKFKSA